MTYAFIIVVSVAVTLKLLFMSFSLYFTFKYNETQGSETTKKNEKKNGKDIMAKCKQVTRAFIPNMHCNSETKAATIIEKFR
ncbi:unnamed protein product [Leptosia nina]|uniref:ATP synthase F0 subunit 8 n=1 Tax=Leptosia nina TaxID=320188 RepID=A0AAV1JCH8_9NEOP